MKRTEKLWSPLPFVQRGAQNKVFSTTGVFRFRTITYIYIRISVHPSKTTHFCRIRDGGGAGRPPPTNNFRRTKLTQQTIYHWKGNLSKSPIHFRYRQNILISRLCEQFSRNDSAISSEKNSNF